MRMQAVGNTFLAELTFSPLPCALTSIEQGHRAQPDRLEASVPLPPLPLTQTDLFHPFPPLLDTDSSPSLRLSPPPCTSNHVDRDFISPPGAWLGCDFAGVVEKVGDGVKNVKEGDRVAAFVHGGLWPEEGSFAEYVKAEASLVWKVPESVSFEEAAAAGGIGPCEFASVSFASFPLLTLSLSAGTAIQALFFRLKLNSPSSPSENAEPVLVWGGATSVGLCTSARLLFTAP